MFKRAFLCLLIMNWHEEKKFDMHADESHACRCHTFHIGESGHFQQDLVCTKQSKMTSAGAAVEVCIYTVMHTI